MMIVRDFNWDSFNRSNNVVLLSLFYKIYLVFSKISFFKELQKDFVDIQFLT